MDYQVTDSRSSHGVKFVVSDSRGDAPDVALATARVIARDCERSGEFRSANGIVYALDTEGPVYVGQV